MAPPDVDSPLQALAPQPLMLVVSGPSGVGKDAVVNRLRERQRHPVHVVVTATTRPLRDAERPGVDYHFLDDAAFRRQVDAGGFLEWAVVYGNCYGVPRDQVREALDSGLDVIIKADVQGAETIRGLNPQGVFAFIAPPSMGELERRLLERNSEDPSGLARRLDTARHEMERLPMFDYVVVNESGALDRTADALESILKAERWRYPRRAMPL